MKQLSSIFILSALLILAGCNMPAEDPEQSVAATDAFEPENHPDDGVRTLRLYMEADDLDYLYERDPNSDVPIAAHAKINEEETVLQLEGVRFRGNSTRNREKKPLSIEFAEPQDFLHGSDRLNLNAMYTDPSMIREQLSFDMFSRLDIPAPRAEYYRLYINDNYEGFYTSVERIDEEFLVAHGLDPEGTLVRDQMRTHKGEIGTTVDSTFAFNLDYHAEDKAAVLEQVYDYRGEPNWLKLGQFQEWVYSTPAGSGFESGLFEYVDEKNFMDFLAVHFIIGDIDTFGNDYWMYLDHQDPDAKWQFIPWDKDLVMGSDSRGQVGGIANDYFSYENPIIPTWQNLLVHKTLASDALRNSLEARILELMDGQLSNDWIDGRIAEHQHIVDGEMAASLSADAFTLHGQNFFGNTAAYDERKETVPEFFDLRYQFLPRHFETPEAAAEYSAEAGQITENEGVYLTNADGFVMAYLEPESVTGDPVMRLTIEQNNDVEGINRSYILETQDGSVEGRLTLYYRNNTGWLSRGNWIMNGSDFEALHDLQVQKDGTAIETTVNPYTNKAVFDDTLEGTARYTIEFTQ
ncbi:CotH kinase family protein [Salinicoccus sp. ID82-1]|uniref:CotH kinase family protein n=1 Tax=Salinicoccus sp. ID82-1 TaxID=2820269 RepID=UPI001F1F5638|nr:CotH kinase family protein [Salinicoccus sp. ID82-1]MCG1009972.1 CotH kinase family protein [Salinicoccus sp. ID82-1]